MADAIVRVLAPEEREYARYLAAIEVRRRRVAELRTEIETLKSELAQFDAEYHALVGKRFVELDQVRLAIDEYERRIAWLKWHPAADPVDMEQEISEAFARRRQELEAEAEEARRRAENDERVRARKRLSADEEAELQRVYRDLAKRFHPDLARTDDERAERQRVMQRVNVAFQERDLAALRDMERAAEITDPAFEAKSIGEKLVWAIREIERLDELISRLETELSEIRATQTHRLWQRQQGGEAVIESLTAQLDAAIVAARDRLATLIATYRDLLKLREEKTA